MKAGIEVTEVAMEGEMHTFAMGWPICGLEIQAKMDEIICKFILDAVSTFPRAPSNVLGFLASSGSSPFHFGARPERPPAIAVEPYWWDLHDGFFLCNDISPPELSNLKLRGRFRRCHPVRGVGVSNTAKAENAGEPQVAKSQNRKIAKSDDTNKTEDARFPQSDWNPTFTRPPKPSLSKTSGGNYPNVLHNNSKTAQISVIKSQYPQLAEKMSLVQIGHYVTNWKMSLPLAPQKQSDGEGGSH
ncbi:hypothetical protein ANOM_011008 [Aspergillus nomiae NRRL 13137]|uniref:Uncharacterized protein n=1 Tax=Aspergillus nomiae NRRL (strain ATCC 15546 / NRRL 13137 / CBS 260.88 / M93) TaxID=1509407 RepID=A0A0L1IMB6_ASPN3|nr:uncharacterized protein ANOM_011008 [Aspergillus nomiae NRRL 13137]KNG80719.1 hypothetical protein ANOM_011008 [Aspergillus nomiae NRRL 13137]